MDNLQNTQSPLYADNLATPIQKFAAADIPSSKEFLYSDALKFIKTVIQDIAKDYSPQNQIARQKQIHYNRPRYVPPNSAVETAGRYSIKNPINGSVKTIPLRII